MKSPRERAAVNRFNSAAEDLSVEWIKRNRDAQGSDPETPHAWLKRAAYKLIKSYLEEGLLEAVHANFRTDHRSSKNVEESLANPFKAGLLAMFSDDSILSRKNRHVYGNQMLYAWAHDVPPEFLNGFLAVTGGAEAIAQKIKTRYSEPGFEHRFRPERLALLNK